MIKKGALNKEDKAYIRRHKSMDIVKMAYTLERNVKTVEAYVNELKAQAEQAKLEEEGHNTEEPKPPTALDMMGRNKKFGAVVMTEAASMGADDSARKRKTKPSGSRNYIHIIRPEE